MSRHDSPRGGRLQRARSWYTPRLPQEAGLTLVEMLVSLLILGVILSATAASLISFTRTAAADERRVQATAVLAEANETFQALPWEAIGQLPSDFDNLNLDPDGDDPFEAGLEAALGLANVTGWVEWEAGGGLDAEPAPLTYTDPDRSTEELVLTADPDAALPVYRQFTAGDGRDYELYQFVTWVDLTGDGAPEMKRYTAIARWQILDRSYEQAFVADRAPSVQEVGDIAFPRLLQFDVFPTTQELTSQSQNSQEIQVALRFNEGVQNPYVRFYVIDDPTVDPEDAELALEQFSAGTPLIFDGAFGLFYSFTIPAEAYTFPKGLRPFTVFAQTNDGALFRAASRDLNFVGGQFPPMLDPGTTPDPSGEPGNGEPPEPVDPVDVSEVQVIPGTVNVRTNNNRTCQTLEVFTSVDGLQAGDVVQLSYTTVQGEPGSTATMDPIAPVVDGVGTFIRTFAAGSDHGFRAGNESTFVVKVLRDGDSVGASLAPPATVTFNGVQKCN